MRLPMLMASLSKCHLCRQYRYSAGKQPINILMGEISLQSKLKMVGDLCFSTEPLWRLRSVTIQNLKNLRG